jgi:hypothetical protein
LRANFILLFIVYILCNAIYFIWEKWFKNWEKIGMLKMGQFFGEKKIKNHYKLNKMGKFSKISKIWINPKIRKKPSKICYFSDNIYGDN